MKRIVIRKIKSDDSKSVLKIFNYYAKNKYFIKSEKIDFKEHIKWLKNLSKLEKKSFFVGILEKKVIGYSRFKKISSKKFEISIALDNKYIGKGYGSKLLKSSIRKLLRITEVKFIYSLVKKINKPSISLFQNHNFKRIITNRKKFSKFNYFKLDILDF